jgi:hypothetical protein
MPVDPNGIYSKQQIAEILGCSIRTVDFYYTLGLPRRKIRSRNYTTGRQLIQFIEDESGGEDVGNPKIINFKHKSL